MGSGDVPRAVIEEVLYILGCSIGPSTTHELGELRVRRDMAIERLHRGLGLTEPCVHTAQELMEWAVKAALEHGVPALVSRFLKAVGDVE